MAKKGSTLVCVPCGQELIITRSGTSYSELWCCGIAMEPAAAKTPKKKAVSGKAAKKTAKKKTVKKASKKKAPAKKKAAKKASKKKAPAKKKASRKK
jgi:hypothetical protein